MPISLPAFRPFSLLVFDGASSNLIEVAQWSQKMEEICPSQLNCGLKMKAINRMRCSINIYELPMTLNTLHMQILLALVI